MLVADMRRQHPRWGAKRTRMELLKQPPDGQTVPATATINRILIGLGLVQPRKRKRPKESYLRWQRPGPMQAFSVWWGLNGGQIPATGADQDRAPMDETGA